MNLTHCMVDALESLNRGQVRRAREYVPRRRHPRRQTWDALEARGLVVQNRNAISGRELTATGAIVLHAYHLAFSYAVHHGAMLERDRARTDRKRSARTEAA